MLTKLLWALFGLEICLSPANCLESCLCRVSRKTYCIIQALANAAGGDVEKGLIFFGANAGRAERIMSVAEVMAELTETC
ncbi:MAG: hypothetical protein AB1861_20010 [Cyanobacteriota bacterium]